MTHREICERKETIRIFEENINAMLYSGTPTIMLRAIPLKLKLLRIKLLFKFNPILVKILTFFFFIKHFLKSKNTN